MRALAHPVRVALLELLTRDGPMTATEAGEALGESPANTSFHLRTLAKFGFVEEAPGGTGRQRPWQRVGLGNSFEVEGDEATAAAARSLADHFARRAVRAPAGVGADPLVLRQGVARRRDLLRHGDVPDAGRADAVGEEIVAIIDRYRVRLADRVGAARRRRAGRLRRVRLPAAADRQGQLTWPSSTTSSHRVAARTPVDERERDEHRPRCWPSCRRLAAAVRHGRRPDAHHRLGVDRRTAGDRAAAPSRGSGSGSSRAATSTRARRRGTPPGARRSRRPACRSASSGRHTGAGPRRRPPRRPRPHPPRPALPVRTADDADPAPPADESQDVGWFAWADALERAEAGMAGILGALARHGSRTCVRRTSVRYSRGWVSTTRRGRGASWRRRSPGKPGRGRARAPGSPSWNAGGDGPAWSRRRQPFEADGVERRRRRRPVRRAALPLQLLVPRRRVAPRGAGHRGGPARPRGARPHRPRRLLRRRALRRGGPGRRDADGVRHRDHADAGPRPRPADDADSRKRPRRRSPPAGCPTATPPTPTATTSCCSPTAPPATPAWPAR